MKPLSKRPLPWVVSGIIGCGVLLVLSISLLYWAIGPQSATERNEFTRTVVQITVGLVQLGGALVLGFGLYFTWNTLEVNRKTLAENQQANRERERQGREGQITDRFTKAVEQLGSDKTAVRLGGIYALERVARDSGRDYSTIIEILADYVRERAPRSTDDTPKSLQHVPLPDGKPGPLWAAPPETDIQAVLKVLARLYHPARMTQGRKLDFRNTDLRRAYIAKATWPEANFANANLTVAIFNDVQMPGANFAGARLLGTIMLVRIDLRGASFAGAVLNNANLFEANLIGAKFGTESRHADVAGVNFYGAQLDGADFRWAENLTPAQLAEAASTEGVLLPTYLS